MNNHPPAFDVATLADWVSAIQGQGMTQRRALAKAITLFESQRSDHRAQAQALLAALLPHTGQSFRVGISGVPGVGKSTLIEALGLHLIAQGHRVAVLAVDPSSSVSGGSILGDKTRMEKLSAHPQAFIRGTPSKGVLGGVASHTREAILLVEAAGYDVVLVETVGVGQSETAVCQMTDIFCLLHLPNAGDDLQAMKKGVMELADLMVINKADVDANAATQTEAHMTSAMRLLGEAASYPKVVKISALRHQGVEAFWAAVLQFKQHQMASQQWQARRRQQALAWMWEQIESALLQRFQSHTQVQALLPVLSQQVQAGQIPASWAAQELLSTYDK